MNDNLNPEQPEDDNGLNSLNESKINEPESEEDEIEMDLDEDDQF